MPAAWLVCSIVHMIYLFCSKPYLKLIVLPLIKDVCRIQSLRSGQYQSLILSGLSLLSQHLAIQMRLCSLAQQDSKVGTQVDDLTYDSCNILQKATADKLRIKDHDFNSLSALSHSVWSINAERDILRADPVHSPVHHHKA